LTYTQLFGVKLILLVISVAMLMHENLIGVLRKIW